MNNRFNKAVIYKLMKFLLYYFQVENMQPREYVKKYESLEATTSDNRNSFISFLLDKHRRQQTEKENQTTRHVAKPTVVHTTATAAPPAATNHNRVDSTAAAFINNNNNLNTVYPLLVDNLHQQKQRPPATPQQHSSVNNENKPVLSTKNSLKISQIIDTMSQQQHQLNQFTGHHQTFKLQPQQQPQQIKLQPQQQQQQQQQHPGATQMIKLNNHHHQPPPVTTLNNHQQLNSTIVKLSTPQQQPQPSSQSTQPQPIKHLVLPKSNQKLIILPNATNGSTTSESVNGPSPGGLISKLVMYKTSKSVEPSSSTNDDPTPTAVNGTISSTQLAKNLKIIGSPSSTIISMSTATSTPTLTANNSKPTVLFTVNNNNNNHHTVANHHNFNQFKSTSTTTPTAHHLLSSLKPIKIVESVSTNGDGDHGPIKRKFQLTNDHLLSNGIHSPVAGNASSPSASTASLTIAEDLNNGGGFEPNAIISTGKIISVMKKSVGSPASPSLANTTSLVCLKMVDSAPKRIKLVDVDLNDELNNQKI
jgi:hypothetical protein